MPIHYVDFDSGVNAHDGGWTTSDPYLTLQYAIDDVILKYKKAVYNGTSSKTDHGDYGDVEYNQVAQWECRMRTVTNGGSIFTKLRQGTTYDGWELAVHSTSVLRFLLVNTYSTKCIEVTGSTALDDGDWHHIVVDYDGSGNASGVTITVDGVEDTPTTLYDNLASNTTVNAESVGTGGRVTPTFGNGFLGDIQDCKLTVAGTVELDINLRGDSTDASANGADGTDSAVTYTQTRTLDSSTANFESSCDGRGHSFFAGEGDNAGTICHRFKCIGTWDETAVNMASWNGGGTNLPVFQSDGASSFGTHDSNADVRALIDMAASPSNNFISTTTLNHIWVRGFKVVNPVSNQRVFLFDGHSGCVDVVFDCTSRNEPDLTDGNDYCQVIGCTIENWTNATSNATSALSLTYTGTMHAFNYCEGHRADNSSFDQLIYQSGNYCQGWGNLCVFTGYIRAMYNTQDFAQEFNSEAHGGLHENLGWGQTHSYGANAAECCVWDNYYIANCDHGFHMYYTNDHASMSHHDFYNVGTPVDPASTSDRVGGFYNHREPTVPGRNETEGFVRDHPYSDPDKRSIQLDGVDQGGKVATGPVIPTTHTISMWCWLENLDNAIIFSQAQWAGVSSGQLWIRILSGQIRYRIDHNSGFACTSTTPPPIRKWFPIVVRFTGTQKRMWIDDEAAISSNETDTSNSSTEPLGLGYLASSDNNYTNCRIADVRVFTTDLAQDDVDYLKNKRYNADPTAYATYNGTTSITSYGTNKISILRTDVVRLEFKFRTTDNVVIVAGQRIDTSPYNGWECIYSSGIRFSLCENDSTSKIELQTPNDFNDGDWHDVVITKVAAADAGSVSIAVDGVDQDLTVVKNNLSGSSASTAELGISARNGNTTYGWNGDLQDLKLWVNDVLELDVPLRGDSTDYSPNGFTDTDTSVTHSTSSLQNHWTLDGTWDDAAGTDHMVAQNLADSEYHAGPQRAYSLGDVTGVKRITGLNSVKNERVFKRKLTMNGGF